MVDANQKIPQRYKSRAVRTDQVAAGTRPQENQAPDDRLVRGVLRSALSVAHRLPMAGIAWRVSQVAHGAFVLFDLE